MKKLYLIILLTLIAVIPAMAKDNHGDREKRQQELLEFKMKYLAQEMQLNASQQTRFFDLYAKMSKEKHAINHDVKKLERQVRKNGAATDADYRNLASKQESARQKELQIDKKYETEFSKFLSSKQLFKMREAEKKFRDKMSEMRQNNKKKNK